MQLVLDTKGLKLTTKGASFHIVATKGSRTISPNKLSSIAITSSILISTTAVTLAIKKRIPILFCSDIDPTIRQYSILSESDQLHAACYRFEMPPAQTLAPHVQAALQRVGFQ